MLDTWKKENSRKMGFIWMNLKIMKVNIAMG